MSLVPLRWAAWAVVDNRGALVAQSWNEQFCLYTTRRDARRSITVSAHQHKPGERVIRVTIVVPTETPTKKGCK